MSKSSVEEDGPKPVGQVPGLKNEWFKVLDPFLIKEVESLIQDHIEQQEAGIPPNEQTILEFASQGRVEATRKSSDHLLVQEACLRAACQQAKSRIDAQFPEQGEELLRKADTLLTQLNMLQARWRIAEKIRWVMVLDSIRNRTQTERPLMMEYPAFTVELNSCLESVPIWQAANAEKEAHLLEIAPVEKRILSTLLGTKLKCKDVQHDVEKDLQWSRNLCAPESNGESAFTAASLVEKMLLNPSVITFKDLESMGSGGLFVTGNHIEISGALEPSFSALVPTIVDTLRARQRHVILIHIVGLREPVAVLSTQEGEPKKHNQKFAGTRDMLRSICTQFLYWLTKEDLEVDWKKVLALVDGKEVQTGQLHELIQLFRELILQLAMVATVNRDRYTLFVVIDGLQKIRSSEQRALNFVTDFFRKICDETCVGDLGGTITFKYMFLNPCTDRFLEKPHPEEHLALLPTLALAGPESTTGVDSLPQNKSSKQILEQTGEGYGSTEASSGSRNKGKTAQYRAPQWQPTTIEPTTSTDDALSNDIGLVPSFPMTIIIKTEKSHAAMHAVGDEIDKLEKKLRKMNVDDVRSVEQNSEAHLWRVKSVIEALSNMSRACAIE